MSEFGIVNTIQAPVLEKTSQPALIAFETKYSAYKERVQNINQQRPASQSIKEASIRQCIKPKILQSLCILGFIEDDTTVEQSSNEAVQKWFDECLNANNSKDLNTRVDNALRKVKFEFDHDDPGGSATHFIIEVVAALGEQNASSIVTESEQCKQLIAKLMKKVEPPALRQLLFESKGMWTKDECSNLKIFSGKLADYASQVQRVQAAEKKDGAAGTRSNSSDEGHRGKKGPRSRDQESKRPHKNIGHQNKGKRPREWTRDCLNPKCSGKHRMSDCPITPHEEAKELLQKHWAETRKKPKQGFSGTRSYEDPHSEDGRYRVFMDEVESVALGDSGATFNAIPKTLFEKVIKVNKHIKRSQLPKPIELQNAITDTNIESSLTASSKCEIPITICIPGSELPVRIRNVEFIVVDQDMSEVLLGRPLLKAIGFDFDEHLRKVQHEINGKSMRELNQEQAEAKSLKYNGTVYRDCGDDPVKPPTILAANFGKDSDAEIDNCLNRMVNEALQNGMSSKSVGKLRSILKEHKSCFRLKLGSDPPANVRPLNVELKLDIKPIKSPQRRYGPQQREFIIKTIKELEKIGAVYYNPNAKWGSPALAVPKPGTTTLRFTVDLRGVNNLTEPLVAAMPHLEIIIQMVGGSVCYANIDSCHGYWQLGLEENSQEIMSIQTPIGVYSPTRVLQGGTDSGNNFQMVTRAIFEKRVKRLLQWLDDFLLYATSGEELLEDIEQFLLLCSEYGFKLHASNCSFFLKQVNFCGRRISADGVTHDPRNFEVITSMKQPRTGAELQQFLCATNWMRPSLPDYSRLIHPLHELMESIYTAAGKRTKKAATKFNLDDQWGVEHTHCFNAIQNQLAASTKLAFPKSTHALCLFTDASDTHWAAVLTQVPQLKDQKHITEQAREPLAFLSGSFNGASSNWSIADKEGYAIVESMNRLDYITVNRITHVYTDHANLLYIYDPVGRNPGIAKHTACKLARWALKLNEFRFVIEHVSGDENIWADILTRWAVQPRNEIYISSRQALKSVMLAPLNPALHKDLDWPKKIDIKESQRKYRKFKPIDGNLESGIWRTKDGKVWIPKKDRKIILRLLIAGHTGRSGHRGIEPTLENLIEHFSWHSVRKYTTEFVKSCIHCISTEPGIIVPRPLGSALHADKPNHLLHFDFCHLCRTKNGLTYVLIIKDDLSGYLRLKAAEKADSETATKHLLDWAVSFGISKTWMSDQGTHFVKSVMSSLVKSMRIDHKLTLPYCPWSNGTVEVVCRELTRACRALLSELQLPSTAWPSVIPLVQSILNNAPRKDLEEEVH